MKLLRRPLVLGFVMGGALAILAAAALWFALPQGRTLLQLRAPSAEASRGEQLYSANCASCHGGPTGGGMMDYPPKHNANGHTWHHSDCELKQVIADGTSPMVEMMREMMAPPGAPTMPAWRDRLSDDEIDAVLTYIKTMWTPAQRASQERATRSQCA